MIFTRFILYFFLFYSLGNESENWIKKKKGKLTGSFPFTEDDDGDDNDS